MVVLVSEGHCPSISRYTRFWYGAAASALGTVFGAINSNRQEKMQIAENQKNRDFAREMAQYQNEQNIEMWKRNNEYNTPAAQVSRMRAAGLNPALMYAGGSPAVPSVAPAMSGGNGANGSVGGNFAPFDALFASRSAAEIENINADTDKKKAETAITWSDAKVRDALNAGAIDLQGVEIKLKSSQSNLTDEEIKKVAPTIENLQASTDNLKASADELRSSASLMDSQRLGQIIENYFNSETYDLRVRDMVSTIRQKDSQSSVNYSNAKRVLKLLTLEYLNMEADLNVKSSLANMFDSTSDLNLANELNARITGKQLQFNLDSDTTWRDIEREAHVIHEYLDGSTMVFSDLGDLFDFKSKIKKPKKIGFRK